MKNPTYSQFMSEVNNFIEKLSKDQFKEIINSLAENSTAADRNNFLRTLKNASLEKHSKETDIELSLTPDEFMEQIQNYYNRMKEGEFYDEEKDYDAYHRSEREYWDDGYYDGDMDDYSSEDYVTEVVEMLETANKFFEKRDIDTAYLSYERLFGIIDNNDGYDEYFLSDFSFKTAIDDSFLKKHKCLYYRCFYLKMIDCNNLDKLFSAIRDEKDILLNDILEVVHEPLPAFEIFLDKFIKYMSQTPKNDRHLIDALFIKGGMDEVKSFGNKNGKKHPPVFLYYYNYAKEEGLPKSELLQILLDGLRIIPEKFQSRSCLSIDLIEMAKNDQDKENLLLGYITAFYSDKSLKNLGFLLNFLISEQNKKEINKLTKYFNEIEIKGLKDDSFYFSNIVETNDIYSLNSSIVRPKTAIVGKYILSGIEPMLSYINVNSYKGFSSTLEYVALIVSLALKTIAGSERVILVDMLIDYYCLNNDQEEYVLLKKMINDRAGELSNQDIGSLLTKLEIIKKISVSRISFILENKYRNAYERSCLFLTASAEALQIVSSDGDALISQVDKEFKRFSAFRAYLKNFTKKSNILKSIS